MKPRTTFLLKANPAQSWSSFPLRLPLHTWASQGLLELGNIPIGRCLTAILHVSISDPFEDWTHMWLFSFFLLRTCETSVVSVWLKICEYKAGYIYIYLGIGELLWSVLCISSNCFEVFCAFHRKVNWGSPSVKNPSASPLDHAFMHESYASSTFWICVFKELMHLGNASWWNGADVVELWSVSWHDGSCGWGTRWQLDHQTWFPNHVLSFSTFPFWKSRSPWISSGLLSTDRKDVHVQVEPWI